MIVNGAIRLALAEWLSQRGRPSGGLPRDKWPAWARELAAQAQPGEVGLGDVAERVVGPFGSDEFKLWWAERNGVWSQTCRCAGWKPLWNRYYPLAAKGSATDGENSVRGPEVGADGFPSG